jgi:MFS family permease
MMQKASWLPMVILVMAQLQMAFNINALPVSIGPIVEDLNTPATSVATGLVLYSLFVAAFVMLGAKLGKLFGERLVFQVSALAHGVAMLLMALATDADAMNLAQITAGIAAALLVPTLVVLLAANYRGRQQEQALGILAAMPAIASGVGFLIAGFIATTLSWRYSFGLIFVLSLAVLILSFRLAPIPRQRNIKIDLVGVVLSAAAILFILVGFNNFNTWGVVMAKPAAPFAVVGVSPAPLSIVFGLILLQSFFAWSERRVRLQKTPLLALEVIDSSEERNAVYAFLVAGGYGAAISFLIPLYIQFVQDRTPLETSIAIIPYAITVAVAAMFSVRFYSRLSPRQLGIGSFILSATGMFLLAFSVSNDWGTPAVIAGLMIAGVGEGVLLTLLFNVLVSSSPKELAGDVGALRGVVNNVSSALGAAFAGVVAVGVLSTLLLSGFNQAGLPETLRDEINFDEVNFVSNSQLKEFLGTTSATEEQVDVAVRINEDARLRALRASFLLLALISLLAIVPAFKLPNYRPGELSSQAIIDEEGRRKKKPSKSQGSKQ